MAGLATCLTHIFVERVGSSPLCGGDKFGIALQTCATQAKFAAPGDARGIYPCCQAQGDDRLKYVDLAGAPADVKGAVSSVFAGNEIDAKFSHRVALARNGLL